MFVELVCCLHVGCMMVVTRVYLRHVSYVPDPCCESYILLAKIFLYYKFFKYVLSKFQKSTYLTYLNLWNLCFLMGKKAISCSTACKLKN